MVNVRLAPLPAVPLRLIESSKMRAAQVLLDGAARATRSGSEPMSLRQIQVEVDAVRRARRLGANPDKRA